MQADVVVIRGKRLSKVSEAISLGFLADRLLDKLSEAQGTYLSPEDMDQLKLRLADLGHRSLVVADVEMHQHYYD